MKIGVIGLGDITQKAYLPVYSSISGIEFHLYTRNQDKLHELARQYRFEHIHSSMESLIESGIQAAFVHTATRAHESIVRKLLESNIHVFVDKPITYDYESSKALVELASEKGLILTVGFNRRYAPVNKKLKEVADPNVVIVQKNRKQLPDDPRTFIFDDFIHVVDTLRFLFPYPVEEMIIHGRMEGDQLYSVVLQFISGGKIGIGIMNRDNGTTEEIAEVMGPYEKRTAYNVSKLSISKDQMVYEIRDNDWQQTLEKRGFIQMVDDFIQAIKTSGKPFISAEDALVTHQICEKVLKKVTKK